MSVVASNKVSNPVGVPSGVNPKLSYRPDIEGLRGLAVLLVVLFHVGVPGFRGGFVGVDVFFVVSGYLISGLLFRELATTSRIAFAQFYARRARRLLPVSALAVAITILACHFLLPPLEQGKLIRTAGSTIVYASNLYFAQSTRDYFAGGNASNPFLHTWSLAVEEQFYLVWPLMLFLLYRIRRSRQQVLAGISIVSVLSFGYCIWATRENQAAAFFLSLVRVWEFGIGAFLGVLAERGTSISRRHALALGYIGLFGILLAAFRFSSSTFFPGYAALLPCLATGALLFSGASTTGDGVGRFLVFPAMQWLGKLSYSLYLWHWPVLVFAAVCWPGLTVTARAACAVGSLGIASATHYFFENPIRFHRFLQPRPSLSIALAGALMIVSAGIVTLWRHEVKSSPQYAEYGHAVNDLPRIYDMGCATGFTGVTPRECSFGVTSSSTRVVLFGDSHAAQWFPALEKLATERSWSLTTLIRNACPAVSVPAFDQKFGRQQEQCNQWRELALERIIALHPSAVVLGSRSRYAKETNGRPASLSYDDWRNGTTRTLARLRSAGIPVLLIADTPRPSFDVPSCLARAAWTGNQLCKPFPRYTPESEAVRRAENDAARQFGEVSVLDPADRICDGAYCDAIRNGMIVYRDDNHLTVNFAGSQTSMFAPSLDMILGKQNEAGRVAKGGHGTGEPQL